ncbi:MAG: hypothetical protein DRP08_04580 [Candidatus Aenigmatarchaeota archaeon]|nr:MAG: hypothetical protein DRP08_04580 [Candidatus Aenigmarchaeota archaeon]
MKSCLLGRLPRPLVVIILFLVLTAMVLANLQVIAAFVVDRFTGYQVSWTGWHGNPFGKSSAETFTFRIPDSGMTLNAAHADMFFRKRDFFDRNVLAWDILLRDVVFTRDPEHGNVPAANPILSVPFDSGWKYSKMAFTVTMTATTVEISGFDADSEAIRLTGAMELAKRSGDISIEFALYMSPDAAEEKMGGFKDMLFQEKDNGWYGSNFRITGNLHEESYNISSDNIQVNFREIK